jgi:hypothetical protein
MDRLFFKQSIEGGEQSNDLSFGGAQPSLVYAFFYEVRGQSQRAIIGFYLPLSTLPGNLPMRFSGNPIGSYQ